MKSSKVHSLVLGLATLLAGATHLTAQGTAFTYQGRVDSGGAPVNGFYDLQFAVYDSVGGGALVGGPLTNAASAVSNGLFAVSLDFGAGVFTGNPRWLEIGVRPNGDGAFTTLSPRQPINATPYAVRAAQFGGAVAESQLPAVVPRLNAANTFSNSQTIATSAQGLLTLNGSHAGGTWVNVGNSSPGGRTWNIIATGSGNGEGPGKLLVRDATANAVRMTFETNGNVGIGTASPAARLDVNGRAKMTELQLGNSAIAGQLLTADTSGVGTWQTPGFVLRTGDTLNGDLTIANPFDLNFGATTRQMLNLFNVNYGLGVQANTLYARSDSGFAWFRGGSHTNNANNPGPGGTNLMWLDSTGSLFANASITLDAPSANTGNIYPGLVFGSGSGEGIASARTAGSTNRYGLDFYTAFQKRLSIANNGNVGINTTSPGGLLDINTGNGRLQVISDLTPGLNLTGGNNPGILRLRNALEVWPSIGGARAGWVDVRDTNGNATITLNGGTGEATVRVLHITGGADIAEPFPMADSEAIPHGAVVVIDEERPGQLRLSERAYDTRVAGIVSGANGIQPGLALHQQGRLEGGRNVALTGRVYALADATSAPIRPGDLLTTSDTPGHVMKVQDRERGHGAILGKAMTPLAEGTGMVLVLVSLQ